MRCFLRCTRSFHTSLISSGRKEDLAELRRRTSLSFVICKQALDKFGDNLDAAEKWAQDEAKRVGAQKAARVAHRQVAQGVVALQRRVHNDLHTCAILEVGCETDFVARNTRFHEFVAQLFEEYKKVFDTISHERLGKDNQFEKFTVPGYRLVNATQPVAANNTFARDLERTNVSGLFRQAITAFGENVALHRGILLCARKEVRLASFVHNSGHDVPTVTASGSDKPVQLGRYAVTVAYRFVEPRPVSVASSNDNAVPETKPEVTPTNTDAAQTSSVSAEGGEGSPDEDADVAMRAATQYAKSKITLGREEVPNYICQHIVAMRPKRIGEPSSRQGAGTKRETDKTDALVDQEYLHDDTRTVGDLLTEHGIAVDDFVRLECGETDA